MLVDRVAVNERYYSVELEQHTDPPIFLGDAQLDSTAVLELFKNVKQSESSTSYIA